MTAINNNQGERLARLEVLIENQSKDIHAIKKDLDDLKRQSMWVRGGVLLTIAFGGLVTWLLNVASKAQGLLK